MMKYLIPILLLLMSLPTQATEGQLWIKPKQCAIKQKGDRCQVSAIVRWELTQPSDVCIIKNDDVMFCHRNSLSGEQVVEIDSVEDIDFKLVEQDSERTLAEATFAILYQTTNRVHLRKVPWRVIL